MWASYHERQSTRLSLVFEWKRWREALPFGRMASGYPIIGLGSQRRSLVVRGRF